jgi:hypothetical protein
LRHVRFDPGGLNRMKPARRLKAFNRRDAASADRADRRDARSDGGSVEVHRARTAESAPAAKLGARESQFVAKNPEQRHVSGDIKRVRLSVYGKRQLRHGTTSDVRLASLVSLDAMRSCEGE